MLNRCTLVCLLFFGFAFNCHSQQSDNFLNESRSAFDQRMAWWREARLGMFIHWGAYAVPAGVYKGKEVSGIGEWIMSTANIPVEEYEQYVEQFNPQQFDADAWMKIAHDAGMKYIVITSKHHDGFCLWDSKVSNYDIMQKSPFKRDILRELAAACKKYDIRLGFYHSIMDWHHPLAKGNDFARYREEYLIPQLKELLQYEGVSVLWFDGEWIEEWTEPQGKALYQQMRTIQPSLIINNRIGKGRQGMQGMNKGDERYAGDFGTPEQEILSGVSDFDWESCMTMNDTWGFKSNDHNWKSAKELVFNIADIAAKGGNYLLNVGPTAEGLIPQPSVERLKEIGDWMKVNGEAIYGTSRLNRFYQGESIRYTYNKSTGQFYAILLGWPGKRIILKNVKPKAGSDIFLLGMREPLKWNFLPDSTAMIELPAALQDESHRPCKYAWVIALKGKEAIVADEPLLRIQGDAYRPKSIFYKKTKVEITAEPGARIYYTLDGSEPSPLSNVYSKPLSLDKTTEVKAIATVPGKVNSGIGTATFSLNDRYKKLQLTHNFSANYAADGLHSLIDGSYSEGRYTDGKWLGFEGLDFELEIDLGESRWVELISANFLQQHGVWIFQPTEVVFEGSSDGRSFKELGRQSFSIREGDPDRVLPVSIALKGQNLQFVRIKAKNLGQCPSWHAGNGAKAWLFVDEVAVD